MVGIIRFGIAGIGMIFGLAVFMLGSKYIQDILPQKTLPKQLQNLVVVFSILLILTLSYLALEYLFDGYLLAVVTCIIAIAFVVIFIKTDVTTRKSLIALLPFYILV